MNENQKSKLKEAADIIKSVVDEMGIGNIQISAHSNLKTRYISLQIVAPFTDEGNYTFYGYLEPKEAESEVAACGTD